MIMWFVIMTGYISGVSELKEMTNNQQVEILAFIIIYKHLTWTF